MSPVSTVLPLHQPEGAQGFDDDEGPSIAEYAAVLIDEEEDIRLFEPVIPREMSDERA